MAEQEERSSRGRRLSRHHRVLIMAGVICTALPAFARYKLNQRVSVDLAAQASESLGLPIELGNASVGLTGTLEIRDVRVGEFFRAKRVMASIGPSASTSGGLAPQELLVDSPRLQLEIDRSGRTNVDDMVERRSSRSRSPKTASGQSSSGLRTLRFVNGALSAKIADVGTVESRGINLWMRDGKLHAMFGQTHLAFRKADFRAEGTLPRAALDYRRGYGLHRLLADGGTVAVKGPRGRAMLKELVISAGLDGDNLQLSAQTGIDRATGSIRATLEPALRGGAVALHLTDTPMALIAPWLPRTMDPRKTLISGEFTATGTLRHHDALALSLRDVNFKGLHVLEPALSSRQLDFDLALDASATLRQTEVGPLFAAKIDSMRSGDLTLSGSVSGQWQRGRRLPELANISVALDEVPCAAALTSLPPGLRPSLAGLELRGNMQSRLTLALARSRDQGTQLEVESGIDGCRVAAEPPTADTRAVATDYEHRTPDGRTRILDRTNSNFVQYSDMPSYVPEAFVAAEDARFFTHGGFDAHQIERSLAIDMENGKLLRGGSTISQQLVKNLFLNRRRSLARKLQEAVLTWRLEANLSKKRILEVYLNIIELGDRHTYGIAEASERWFGVEPSELSVLQTAFLAALTPEPTSMSERIRDAGKLDAVSAGRVATILRVMRRSKVISSSEYRKAKSKRLRLRTQRGEERTANLDSGRASGD